MLTAPDPQLEAIYQEMRDAPPGADLVALADRAQSRYLALIDPRATTPGSLLPYPLPTDPISQGADAIHALASALDYLKGTTAVAASGVTTVTFAPAGFFTKPPIVLIFPYIPGNVGLAYMAGAPTAANFQVRCYTTAGAQVAGSVMWIAVPSP